MIKVKYLRDSINKNQKMFGSLDWDEDYEWLKNYKYEFEEFFSDMKFVEEYNYGIVEWSVLLKDFMVRGLGCDVVDLNVYREIIIDAKAMYLENNLEEK